MTFKFINKLFGCFLYACAYALNSHYFSQSNQMNAYSVKSCMLCVFEACLWMLLFYLALATMLLLMTFIVKTMYELLNSPFQWTQKRGLFFSCILILLNFVWHKIEQNFNAKASVFFLFQPIRPFSKRNVPDTKFKICSHFIFIFETINIQLFLISIHNVQLFKF